MCLSNENATLRWNILKKVQRKFEKIFLHILHGTSITPSSSHRTTAHSFHTDFNPNSQTQLTIKSGSLLSNLSNTFNNALLSQLPQTLHRPLIQYHKRTGTRFKISSSVHTEPSLCRIQPREP